MIKLGRLNSRMKDFYDIWNMIRYEEISGAGLQGACVATFKNRRTSFNLEDDFFSREFAQSTEKQTQWSAFVRKQGLQDIAPSRFEAIIN